MVERTLLQFFHWYQSNGGLWNEIAEKADELAALGITDVWLPPASKGAAGRDSMGYDTYDLFDLGEFDQKGTVATRFGDRAALERAVGALKQSGVRVIVDAVLNHKLGADEQEKVRVRRVDPKDRTATEGEEFDALAYTRFTFPGRAGKYSRFIWDAKCFSGVDTIQEPEEIGLFRLLNEYGAGEWNTEVDSENGNFDFLMGADVEFRNRAVYEELKYWGRWMAEQLPLDGFRLDAVKHIPAWFFRDWVGHMRGSVDPDLFVVAEYWHPDVEVLRRYLELVDRQLTLFDAPLHQRFHDAGRQGGGFDMRTIFDGTLVAMEPAYAVTLVDNHDTQPLQALEQPVEPWFKPLAYALILLRQDGIPCVFYPDLFGARYVDKGGDAIDHEIELPAIASLPKLIEARRRFANGSQTDVFDDPHCVAFARHGTAEEPGCIVVLSNGQPGEKAVDLGPDQSRAEFVDFLGHRGERIVADGQGRGVFPVDGGSVSVWVRSDEA